MRATLLIVEDDGSLRRLMRLMLEREGFLVRGASNGEEALAAIAEYGLPDLALVDLMMPVMNGQEFVAELHARNWDLPAIFVSASTEAQEVCAQMGMACVLKPYDFHVLLEAIETMLATPSQPESAGPNQPVNALLTAASAPWATASASRLASSHTQDPFSASAISPA